MISTNVISNKKELDGFDAIDDTDKATIVHLIENSNASVNLPLLKAIPSIQADTIKSSPKLRTSQLKSLLQHVMNVMFTNVDQLTSMKMAELRKHIQREKPLVVAISEMKPKNNKERTLRDYDIPGYSIHPVNLETHIGRGLAIYTHSSIDQCVVQIESTLEFEEVCLLEIRLRGGDMMLFGCFYRSPTPSSTSDRNNENLNRLLCNISKKKYSHKCFVGDFNFKDIDWANWTTFHDEGSKEATFIEAIRDCYLHQHNEQYSRRRGNDKPSLIDLIFTDEEMQVSEVIHHAPLGKSDHDVITFKFNCYLDSSKPKDVFVYAKADFESMRRELTESDWEEIYLSDGGEKSVEDLWHTLKLKLLELRNKFVPKQKFSTKVSWKEIGGFPINEELQVAIRNKRTAHRHWMSKKNYDDAHIARLNYTKARNKVTKLMRQSKRKYENDIARKSKTNPKAFWSHIRRRLKTKTGVSPLLEDINDKTSIKFKDKEKADILQKQFSDVFTREPNGDIPKLDNRTDIFICDLYITSKVIEEEIKEININKSCGPDEIHPSMLKELISFMSRPIALLLNKSISQGVVPVDWKRAYVSPIYKKGPRNRAENYRPISLTSIICKLLETFIKRTIVKHLIDQQLLSPKQYGFISGRSTTTQLLMYLDKCIETIVDGGVVDSIYMDFSKAFDSVPHRRLIGKLESYGVRGKILNWITEFLTARSQVVKVNNAESSLALVLSGIPQGSVLGPTLFIIYINDLLDDVNSNGLLFADDAKIFSRISSVDDALSLQSDINLLENWSKLWLLNFHPDKCHVLTLGKFDNIKHTQRYSIAGNELEHVFDEKDLGVTIDSNLTFEDHISLKVKKANVMVGLIRRSFTFLSCNLFKKLYTTFVRPHLEYAQTVWSPHLKRYINVIENVQIRATKLVDGLSKLSYSERLRRLDLPTLVYRRARGDMIEVYKHFHSYDPATLPDSFQPKTRLSRKHSYQLHELRPRDGTRGIQTNSFYYRAAKVWNNLPRKVVDAKNLNLFKNFLDDQWRNEEIKFNHVQLTPSDS